MTTHYRFESKKVNTTRLLYCTTGVLLRKIQNDPLLSDVSHVIVDEVRNNECSLVFKVFHVIKVEVRKYRMIPYCQSCDRRRGKK